MDKNELISKIKTSWPVYDDTQFKEIISAVLDNNFIREQELADLLSVSRPKVDRWKRGKNLPHLAIRQPIIRKIGRASCRERV